MNLKDKIKNIVEPFSNKATFGIVIDDQEFYIADQYQEFYENNIQNDLEIKTALDIAIALELIFDRNISKTLDDAFVKVDYKQTPFLDNGKSLYLPVSVIEKTIEGSEIEISLPFLSGALTKMGYKSEGSILTFYKTTNDDIAQQSWEFLRKWKVEKC